MVHEPPHYQNTTTVILTNEDGTVEEIELSLEVVDIMEMFFDDQAHLATALIYLLRVRKRGETAKDIDKCIWWLKRYLEHEDLESEHNQPVEEEEEVEEVMYFEGD